MSKRIVKLPVAGEEWWLKPEHQPEHETREEWKSRTFSMRYGIQNTESEKEGVAEQTQKMVERLNRGENLIPGFNPKSIKRVRRASEETE